MQYKIFNIRKLRTAFDFYIKILGWPEIQEHKQDEVKTSKCLSQNGTLQFQSYLICRIR